MTVNRYSLSRFMCTINKQYNPYPRPSALYTVANNTHESVNCTPSNSWKASTFPVQLGNTNPRPVGVTNCGWLPVGIVSNPSPDHLSPSNEWVQRGASPDNQGSGRAAIQGCNSGGTTTARELCVPDFPRRKERWWPEASGKSEMFEPVYESRTFQDGEPPNPSGFDSTRGLDDQARPKRCILTGSHTLRPSEIPCIQVEQPFLPVQMSPFRVVHGPKGLHQIAETNSRFSETSRMSPDNRHPSPPSGQGTTVQHLSVSQPVVSVSGTTDKRGEILANPLPTDGISRLPPMLPVITDICPGRENKENSTRCHKDPIAGPGYGPGAGQIRVATVWALPLAPLHYRALQFQMNAILPAPYQGAGLLGHEKYNTRVLLDEASRADLRWWKLLDRRRSGSPIRPAKPTVMIESDASTKGWGAVLNTQTRTGGVWSVQEASNHINYLELLAAFLALKAFGKSWTDLTVLLRMDNFTAVTYVNQKGGTCS